MNQEVRVGKWCQHQRGCAICGMPMMARLVMITLMKGSTPTRRTQTESFVCVKCDLSGQAGLLKNPA